MKKLIIILLTMLPLHIGMAFEENDHENALKLNEQGKIVPLESIIDKLHQHTTGRLLQVELHDDNKRQVYEVEVVDENGFVWAYRYDASNGNFIDVSKDSN